MAAEKKRIRKENLNVPQLFSPDLNTDSGKVPLYPRSLIQLNSGQLFRIF
jgi:hypothetical protein